ncbi:MAG: hypothetical protein ACK53Y_09205, partial [bacterium]
MNRGSLEGLNWIWYVSVAFCARPRRTAARCVILVAPTCWLLVALSHTISPFLLNTGKLHLSVCLC